MEQALIAAAFVGGAGVALWGWGWAVRRCARSEPLSVTLTVAVGLGGVIFLGGLLNLAGFAYRGALDGVVVGGWLLAAIGFVKRTSGSIRLDWRIALAAIPFLVAGGFVIACLTPWRAFNHHDDFERYFAYPVRMLATGTVAGNPLGYMGGDTLGGQAYLQGFVAAHLPLAHVGDVDTLFGLLLCLALAGFAIAPGRWAVGAVIAELCVVAINPQIVNVAALFTSAALMMAAVFVSARAGPEGKPGRETANVLLGVLYAGLVVLKTTNVLFVVIHAAMLAAVGPEPGWRRWRWLGMAGIWTLVFLLPWVLLHASHYLVAGPERPVLSARPLGEPLHLFSPTTLVYGSSQLDYSLVALAGLVVAGLVWFATRRGRAERSGTQGAIIAAGVCLGVIYLVLIVGGNLLFGVEAATRYACPVLIGVLPALLRLGEQAVENSSSRLVRAWPVALGTVVVVLFAPSLMGRVRQIADSGVPLAYYNQFNAQQAAGLAGYTREVLEGSESSRLRTIQAMIPEREPVAVWVMAPFLLDFRRNPIWHTDPYGLGMPWVRLPPGCHYFLLEHDGYAVRSFDVYRMQLGSPGLADRVMAARTLDFIEKMQDLMRRGKVIHVDESYALVRLPD